MDQIDLQTRHDVKKKQRNVNRCMVGVSGVVAISVDVNQAGDYQILLGDHIWVKFWRELLVNSTTMDLIVLRLDVSLIFFLFLVHLIYFSLKKRGSQNTNSMGKTTVTYERTLFG